MLPILAGQITSGSGAATEMCTFAVSLGKPSGREGKKEENQFSVIFSLFFFFFFFSPPLFLFFLLSFFFSVSARKEGIKYGLLQGGLSERKRCSTIATIRTLPPSLYVDERVVLSRGGGRSTQSTNGMVSSLFPHRLVCGKTAPLHDTYGGGRGKRKKGILLR